MTESYSFSRADIELKEGRVRDLLNQAQTEMRICNAMRMIAGLPEKQLFDVLGDGKSPRSPILPAALTPQHASFTSSSEPKSVTDIVLLALSERDCVPYKELRVFIEQYLLEEGEGRSLTDGNFYQSLKHLSERGQIVRHNSVAYTPEAAQAADIDEQDSESSSRSRLYDDIVQMLDRNSGSRFSPAQIKSVLMRELGIADEEFGIDNRTLYRILKRLARQEKIAHDPSNGVYFSKLSKSSSESLMDFADASSSKE